MIKAKSQYDAYLASQGPRRSGLAKLAEFPAETLADYEKRILAAIAAGHHDAVIIYRVTGIDSWTLFMLTTDMDKRGAIQIVNRNDHRYVYLPGESIPEEMDTPATSEVRLTDGTLWPPWSH